MAAIDEQEPEINLKILIIGDSNVGKTSLLMNYTDKFFPESHLATVGVEYKIKEISLQGIKIKLQIWDTAGQERFKSITKSFFRNANGVIFVYDITNKKSFDNVKEWIKDAENNSEGFKKILIGNKVDLEKERLVSKIDLKNFGEKKNIFTIEASAKNDINVTESFEALVTKILEGKTNEQIFEEFGAKDKSLSISRSVRADEKKRKCCF